MADEKKNDEDRQPIAPPPVARHLEGDYMAIASERLSQVRYVFVVQIEDGVASAHSRSCLEYADAVLMSWPEDNADGVLPASQVDGRAMAEAERNMEEHISAFRLAERANKTDQMGDELVKTATDAATIRRAFQPAARIPTLDEVSRVVSEEWNEEMGSLDTEEMESSARLRKDVAIANQHGPHGNIPTAKELREKREHDRREEQRRKHSMKDGPQRQSAGPSSGSKDRK